MHFNFVAGDQFDLSFLANVDEFIDHYPDFQTISLSGENELMLLLELVGIQSSVVHNLTGSAFRKYWDLSGFNLPEFDQGQFDVFYAKWIERSNRENNMDEYGSLIFLQGLSAKWNQKNYRLIVLEGD